MAFLRQKNPQGYVFGELYSALQKSMRRGLEDDSIYWARQIGNTNPNALHKRLLLCALEDMSYPAVIRRIMTTPPSPVGMSEMLRLTITLCRVPKTHITAWANRVAGEIILQQHNPASAAYPFDQRPELLHISQYLLENKDGRRDLVRTLRSEDDGAYLTRLYRTANEDPLVYIMHILLQYNIYLPPALVDFYAGPLPADNSRAERKEFPDWVFDKHTARGKSAGRGYAHFFAEGVVFNVRLLAPGQDPYEQEARRLYLDYEQRLGSKARTRTGQLIARYRRPEPKGNEAAAAESGKRKADDDDDEEEVIDEAKEKKRPATPTQGKEKAKRRPTGHAAPAVEPSQVRALLETRYANLLQTQLITGSYKPRVFFATSTHAADCPRDPHAGVPVAIKGPVTREFAQQQLQAETMKRILRMPHGFMRLEELGAALSLFLVARSFVKYDPNAYVLRTSSLETDAKISTNVVEPWDHRLAADQPRHPLTLKVLMALAFRKAIGTNDTTPRNFILFHNYATGEKDLATIDDPALMQDTQHMWKTQIKPEQYKRALAANWPDVRQGLQRWIGLVQAVSDNDMPALFKQYVLRKLAILNNDQANWPF